MDHTPFGLFLNRDVPRLPPYTANAMPRPNTQTQDLNQTEYLSGSDKYSISHKILCIKLS